MEPLKIDECRRQLLIGALDIYRSYVDDYAPDDDPQTEVALAAIDEMLVELNGR